MKKTNKFHVKKLKDKQIIVEQERKERSAFILFFIRNGRLLFAISMILSFTVFLIAIDLAISNLDSSTIVEHESNGIIVSYTNPNGTEENNYIINGIPITSEYANKIFDSQTISNSSEGVVIKVKESSFKGGKVVFYSDKTALIKYDDGRYLRVFKIDNDYGVDEKGIISANAVTKKVTGEIRENASLKIELLYLSDGTIEITKDDTVIFIRNTNITNLNDKFYTNTSGVSVVINKDGKRIYYSDGTIKEGNTITINNQVYNVKEEKEILNGIKIIYYENNYAEIIYKDLSILVEKSEHIVYDDSTLEIINNDQFNENIDINDFMNIKEITLKNTNDKEADYMIVLEETDDYSKYNIEKRLANEFINFNILVNNKKINNQVLNNNIKGTPLAGGLSLKNNTYLLYEGNLSPNEEAEIKLGLWISYENITNEYMNSAFIGTLKVYVESLS